MDRDILKDFKGLKATIDNIWRDMAIADEEIRRGQGNYPAEAERINSCFKLLLRPPVIQADALYRAHVRELVERVANEQDTRPVTRAELLAMMSEMTLQVKTNKLCSLILAHLMDLLLYGVEGADAIAKGLRESAGAEEYPGQTVEGIRELQAKHRIEHRVLD